MTVAAPLPRQQVAEAVMDADSNMTTDPQGAGSSVANSFMRVARPSQNHAAVVSIVGSSALKLPAQRPSVLGAGTSILGAALVTAIGRQKHAASAPIVGASMVTVSGSAHHSASVVSHGTSGATASASANHSASVSIAGDAVVTATAS